MSVKGTGSTSLLATHPIDVYLMNTGWIVNDKGPGSRKISVADLPHCSDGDRRGRGRMERGATISLRAAETIPGLVGEDAEILQPKKAFERLGANGRVRGLRTKLKTERRAFLEGFPTSTRRSQRPVVLSEWGTNKRIATPQPLVEGWGARPAAIGGGKQSVTQVTVFVARCGNLSAYLA